MNRKQKTMTRNVYVKKTLLIVFCSLLIFPLLWNLLRPGFYASHDGEWMVIRLTAFHQSLKEGQFPVRWLSRLDHEYGYPVVNFLYPLPFYLAEPLYAVFKDPVFAIKIVMAVSVVSMALGMYLLMKSRGILVAFASAISYAYSPYVAFNLYQRGSFGEIVAMGIAPWIFWAISRNKLPVSTLLLAALILSHNVVAILFLPLIVAYNFYKSYKTYNNYKLVVISIILSFGLSIFFWFPALNELKYVRASRISVSDFQDEYLPFGAAIERTGIVQSLLTLGAPLYLMSQNSSWFWNSIPGIKIIQFPWRILSIFSFIGAIIAASLLSRLGNNKISVWVLAAAVIFISFRSSWPFLRPSSFVLRSSSYYQTNDDSTTVRAEYTPIWVQILPSSRPESPTKHFYPGWRAFLGKTSIPLLDPSRTNGELQVAPQYAKESVRFMWSETPGRTIADLVSAFSLLLLLFWYQRQNGHYRTSKD